MKEKQTVARVFRELEAGTKGRLLQIGLTHWRRKGHVI
jgi:hypothetical protein